MRIKGHNILFTFLFSLMFIHLAFSPLHWIKDKDLDGYYVKSKDSNFVWQDYFSKKLQDSTDKYLNYSFGMFPAFIRIHHQIEYSLFGNIHVADVHRGKEGYLMRYPAWYFNNATFINGKLEDYVKKYSILRDSLKAAGKNIIWAIAPDKNLVYHEFLPDSIQKIYKGNRFYEDFKQAFKNNNLELLDFNEQAIKDRNKYPFEVCNKGGVHWTCSYAARMFDQVCIYLERADSIVIRNTFKDTKNRTAWAPDLDIENSANLLIPLEKSEFYFTEINSVSSALDKKLLLIGDSFCHAWVWNRWYQQCFSPESEFWYYNRQASTLDDTFKRNLDHKNAREQIRKFDTFIILFSAANIEQLDYGFVEDLYR